MIRCSICGDVINKPGIKVFYFYRDTENGREDICDNCAYNFFDDWHVHISTDIAEALDENIEIPIRGRVREGVRQ